MKVFHLSLLLFTTAFAQTSWTTGTWTTGYWDCCKPSCSWPNKGNVNQPVAACDTTTGNILQDSNAASACEGGNSASCPNNQPFLVNANLAMGFAAAAVSGDHGLTGDDNCGQCYELRFIDQIHTPDNWGGAHPDLVGKTMIVQLTNIGYDVNGEHSFDIQIPGAGQGLFSNGCTAQFPGYSVGDFDCDNRYGGCSNIAGCSRLPTALQDGCEWRYNWYKWLISGGQTNNPYVDFRRVRCPTQLTDISLSIPNDDADYPEINPDDYLSDGSDDTSTSTSNAPTGSESPTDTSSSDDWVYGGDCGTLDSQDCGLVECSRCQWSWGPSSSYDGDDAKCRCSEIASTENTESTESTNAPTSESGEENTESTESTNAPTSIFEDPCANKQCGDDCSPDCGSDVVCPTVMFYCQADGSCSSDADPQCETGSNAALQTSAFLVLGFLLVF